MLAITRSVSPSIGKCLLTYLGRAPIDAALAARQQQAYEWTLELLGVNVISLPASDDLPDCVFVEDTAIVVDEVAVLANMRNAARQRERDAVAEALLALRPLRRIEPPATLEGGDVFRVGRTLFVGLSTRTNQAGADALRSFVEPCGYTVRTVRVTGCLHLSTGASPVAPEVILANPAWVDASAFDGLQIMPVDAAEQWAANTIQIGETILMPTGFPRTRAALDRRGVRTQTVDVSELAKAEGGLSCMSLRMA